MAKYNPDRFDVFRLLRSKHKHVAVKHSQEFKQAVSLCLEEILEIDKDNMSPKEQTGYTLSEGFILPSINQKYDIRKDLLST